MGSFIKPGGNTCICIFFPEGALFHKILILTFIVFCTGCCNTQQIYHVESKLHWGQLKGSA